VVLIDIEIPSSIQLQIKCSMPRHQLQHVIEKSNARRNPRLPVTIKIHLQADLGFVGLAIDRG
jgi:hypothetical protein